GSYPNALALSQDGSKLYVANASSDAVAVFDMEERAAGLKPGSKQGDTAAGAALKGRSTSTDSQHAAYLIPTEWYPTALAVHGDELLIATGKGQGTGPNPGWE